MQVDTSPQSSHGPARVQRGYAGRPHGLGTDTGHALGRAARQAEKRTRVSCQTDCAALEPSVDVLYTDVWTDVARAPLGAAISYQYSNLTTTAPTNVNCIADWTAACRTIINYEMHIHPLWSAPRQVLDPNNGNVLADHTCAQSSACPVTR